MYSQHLKTKLSTYFKNHLVVTLKATPVPTTAKEAEHLYNNFKRLGNLEYFKIRRDRSKVNIYDQHITLIYNPCEEFSLLRPLDDTSILQVKTERELAQSSSSLLDVLNRLIALPRHSFLEGDDRYWKGNEQVLFKYHMRPDGLKFAEKYDISSSTLFDQFCLIQDDVIDYEEVAVFRRKLRHNFQKFHKFDSIKTSLGLKEFKTLTSGEKNENATEFEYSPIIDYKRLLINEENDPL